MVCVNQGVSVTLYLQNMCQTNTFDMKKSILTLIILLCAFARPAHASADESLFPYPVAPDEKTLLSERCNYLVDHFWDRCNLKQAFSSLSRLDKAFGDWLAFMPYATADTVHMAIDRLITDVKKSGPNTLELGKIAERWLYCDTAEYASEELYYPFAKAVAIHKKISSGDKARFEAQVKILECSQVGVTAPDFRFTAPDESEHTLSEATAHNIILFFNDPDCSDCTLAKVRLSADYSTNALIEAGALQIVSIYPGEATEEWKEKAGTYPSNWIVGASDEIDTMFDLRNPPVFYYLDEERKILAKNLIIDNILNALRLMLQGK